MTKRINGEMYAAMVKSAAAHISNNRQRLNELNVFPVPDGDTGTNMALTMQSAADELSGFHGKKLNRAAELTASALLRGARGNSGVIISLLFRGFSRSIRDMADIGTAELAEGLNEGVAAAYKAVMKPAEGTILTVSRVSSIAAREAASAGECDISALLTLTLASAREALEETVHQNPVLEKAGVVDAGGMGYVFMLEGMLAALAGEPVANEAPGEAPAASGGIFASFDTESITFGYCTEYIVTKAEAGSDALRLRAVLESMGDSVVVVDDDEIIKVHVHTDNPGLAVEEGLKFGALSSIKIENMREQHTERVIGEGARAAQLRDAAPAEATKPFGFVAVAAGAGLSAVFSDLGADELVEGGQTMNPSTSDILAASNRVPAETVFILPNNKNIILAAEQAGKLSTKRLVVLPTKSVPQGISALLAFDETLTAGQNIEAMTGAFSQVRTGQLTYAARDSLYDGKKIRMGEFIALIDGKLGACDHDFTKAARAMIKRLRTKDAAFVTIFAGKDATAERTAVIEEAIRHDMGESGEMSVIDGGQPVYSYIVSVE